MRYQEFKIAPFPPILEDINGIQNYSLYIDLIESELLKNKLYESVDENSIEILKKLETLAVSNPTEGSSYSYIFLMFDANNQLHVLGNQQKVELTRINNNEYTFSDGKTYPDGRWSKLAYWKLYIFDNDSKIEKFKTYLRLKFNSVIENQNNAVDITERKQQRTEIMYHGTSSKLVPSILKNGLLATPPKKTYDVDTYGAATASMGGVYVADNKEFANLIAQEAVGTHGGEPALVTLQYVKGSGDLDEDDIVAAISDAAEKVMKDLAQKDPTKSAPFATRDFDDAAIPEPKSKYSNLSYPSEGWATDQMILKMPAAAKKIAATTVDVLSKYSKPSKAAQSIIEQMATQLLQHAKQFEDARDRWNAVRYDAYEIMREQMEQLLAKLMRQVSPDTADKSAGTRRIDRDIKFKGKTRILKIEVGDQVVYPRKTA